MRRSVRRGGALAAVAGVTAVSGCAHQAAGPGRRAAPAPTARVAGGDSVSVGYGMRSRRTLTGAVGTVGGETVQRDGVQRVEEMLRRVPGVVVTRLSGGSYSVRVRGGGVRLLAGASTGEPLIVLDGMPLPIGPGALDSVSPADVDRIDVLKDADASIYGSRGANGVILVRTRRWKP